MIIAHGGVCGHLQLLHHLGAGAADLADAHQKPGHPLQVLAAVGVAVEVVVYVDLVLREVFVVREGQVQGQLLAGIHREHPVLGQLAHDALGIGGRGLRELDHGPLGVGLFRGLRVAGQQEEGQEKEEVFHGRVFLRMAAFLLGYRLLYQHPAGQLRRPRLHHVQV